MPLYEYGCTDCGKKFEVLVRDSEKITCEACGSSKVKKLFSSFAVHAGSSSTAPECSTGCGGGFQQGTCGSGMCHGH